MTQPARKPIRVNPKSLENLKHEGRPLAFAEEKKRRTLTVTESGWNGAMAVAKTVHCRGISELIELIGRGELVVVVGAADDVVTPKREEG